MRILDISAGNRAVWFDKHNPLALFLDCRPEVEPDIVGDSRSMPQFNDSWFDMVVFDPPHVNFGANANMAKNYGHYTTDEIRSLIFLSSIESSRVVKPDGLMAFKWNDHSQKLDRVLELMAISWEPLFGHKTSQRTKHSSTTYWVMLRNKK